MNVVFVFGGLPHYFNHVLNRINQNEQIQVFVIVPQSKSETIGSGVHESDQDAEFNIIRLKEYKTFYGKPFFKHFYQTLLDVKADKIVIGWPYFLAFIFNPLLLVKLKAKGVKIYSKEIPFSVPALSESMKKFNERSAESQKKDAIYRSNFVLLMHKLMRYSLYRIVFDHALLYIESGLKIIGSYGFAKKKMTVTYNSPNTDIIFQTIEKIHQGNVNLKRKPFSLLHVGRLVDWKKVDMLINAVYDLKNELPQLTLTIIGKGEEENFLISEVNRLELQNRITFLGAIYEPAQLSKEMLTHSVYVLAGMGGLSINEAMAHAMPIICTKADGTEEHLVYNESNGLRFEDNNKESLKEAIRQIFKMDLVKMGHESQNIIRNQINIESVSQKYVEALLS